MTVVIRDYRDSHTTYGTLFDGTLDEAFLACDPSGWALVSWDIIAAQGWEIEELHLGPPHHEFPISPSIEIMPLNRRHKDHHDKFAFFRFLSLHQQWILMGSYGDAYLTYLPDHTPLPIMR